MHTASMPSHSPIPNNLIPFKKTWLASAALFTVLALSSGVTYADCGTATLNDSGGNDYALGGAENSPCTLVDHDTLSITEGGSISTTEFSTVIASGVDTSITNKGTVQNTAEGFVFYVANGDTRAALSSLTNNGGTITTNGNVAVYIVQGTITTLDNSYGTIHSDNGSAIAPDSLTAELDDPDNGMIETVINYFGTISVGTGTAFGNSGTVGTFNNDHGTIESTGAGSYAFANSGKMGQMTNNGGLITSSGGFAFANSSIMALDNTNGIIRGTGNNTDAMFLMHGFTDTLKNTNGLITTSGADSITLYINADTQGFSVEGGTISNTSNANNVVAVNIGHEQSGLVKFDGVHIIADGDTPGSGHANALSIFENTDLELDNGTVVRGAIFVGTNVSFTSNYSSIVGNLTTGTDTTVIFNHSSLTGNFIGNDPGTLEFQSNFTTEGTITTLTAINATIDSGATLTINHAADLGTGTLTIDHGGSMTLNAGNLISTGDFINHGTTTIGSERTLSVGSLNTTPTDGTLTYITTNHTGALKTGYLDTQETAANLSHQNIHIHYIGTGLLDRTTRSLIATGTGTPSAPTTPVTDDSFLYDFSIINPTDNPDKLYLTTQLTPLMDTGSNQRPLSTSQILVNTLANTTDPVIVQIQTNLASAPDHTTYNHVLEATEPTVNQSSVSSVTTMTSTVFDVVSSQITSPTADTSTGIPSGDATSKLHVWAQGFGSHATQGERGGIGGYSANMLGAATGIDTHHLDDQDTVGFSLAYGKSRVRSSNANRTHTDVTTYQGTIYGKRDFEQHISLTGMIAFGVDENTETRHDVGAIAGTNASADYNAWQTATRVELSRSFIRQPTDPILTPSISADYLHYKADGYTETGAGGANLHIGPRTADNLNLGVGLKAQWQFKTTDGTALRPDVHAGYSYNMMHNDRIDATGSFAAGGGTFTTHGIDPSSAALTMGTALNIYSLENWNVTGSYDYTFRADYHASSGMIRAGYRF